MAGMSLLWFKCHARTVNVIILLVSIVGFHLQGQDEAFNAGCAIMGWAVRQTIGGRRHAQTCRITRLDPAVSALGCLQSCCILRK